MWSTVGQSLLPIMKTVFSALAPIGSFGLVFIAGGQTKDREHMKTKLIIECSGGVVTAVYSNRVTDVTLIDWDDVAEGDRPIELPVAPLDSLSEESQRLLREV